MLETAVFLSLVANRVVESVAAPVKIKYPKADLWWLIYVSWVLGGALSYLAGLNLFAAQLPNGSVGLVLTAFVVGGGSNLLADLFKFLRSA